MFPVWGLGRGRGHLARTENVVALAAGRHDPCRLHMPTVLCRRVRWRIPPAVLAGSWPTSCLSSQLSAPGSGEGLAWGRAIVRLCQGKDCRVDISWSGDPIGPLGPHAAQTVQRFLALVSATTPRIQIKCLFHLQLSLDSDPSFTPVEVAARHACLHALRLLLRQRAE